MTTPLTMQVRSFRLAFARPLVRILIPPVALATLAGSCLAAWVAIGPTDVRPTRWVPSDAFLIASATVLGALWLAKLATTTLYLSGLASRSGDPQVHRHGTGLVMGGGVLAAAVVTGVPATWMFGIAFVFPPLCAYWPAIALGGLGWIVGYMSLLHLLRRRLDALRWSEREQQEHAGAESGPD